ncbi:MAG TPA: NAD-dependent epimerase/dehydratase family protein [Gemmatimonadaceae bacterium]|jgi:NADH dehydrogenase|nr:NAD-dependent epimerase/dehydratase family protein [Gemmatimonadaceae bacterium]
MRVLVTGGTGVIGESTVRALHAHGHQVRVLSRHAGRDERWWPSGVEGWAGDVSDEPSIRGSADGCDVVLHIAGIVDETPPERTFQRINIDGTRYVVLEAERGAVRKVIYVSSLGAERGSSAYQRSKFVAEDVVRTFTRDWLVIRPGAVFGPGDAHASVLLQMVRALPAVPTIGDGNQPIQPIWHEDFAEVLVAAVERDDLRCRTLEIAGAERTSQNDLVRRFREVTGRPAVQLPLPELVASWGLRALEIAGVEVPFNEQQLQMLQEGSALQSGTPNALTEVFGVTPTPLDEMVRRLAVEQPEQLPSDGVGTLTRKRFWIDIRGGSFDADRLFAYVRGHLPDLLGPTIDVKEADGGGLLDEGDTVTLGIPVRGESQVRVAEVMDRRLTLLTVAGHPIAGAVRFLVERRDDAIRFEIQVYDRAATVIDQVMMRTVGEWLQRRAWLSMAERVARASGGSAGDVQSSSEELTDRELELVDEWASTLSAQLSRNATSSGRD